MAVLTPLLVSPTGLEDVYVAAAVGGDKVPNPDGKRWVRIINGGGSDINVTVVTPATYKGKALADDVIVVTAGEPREIGFWDPELYNNASGQVDLAYSGVTDVTIATFYHN